MKYFAIIIDGEARVRKFKDLKQARDWQQSFFPNARKVYIAAIGRLTVFKEEDVEIMFIDDKVTFGLGRGEG